MRSEFALSLAQGFADAFGMGPLNVALHPQDPLLAKRIGAAYELLPTRDQSSEVRAAYTQFSEELLDQHTFLVAHGLTIKPWLQEGQPYPTSEDMIRDVEEHHQLYVFQGGEVHPFLGRYRNNMFRAVHDVLGHAAHGVGFGPWGEENAWRFHSQLFSPLARKALTTETRGQNCWVNFGPHNYNLAGEHTNRPLCERPYAAQKVALLPQEFVEL